MRANQSGRPSLLGDHHFAGTNSLVKRQEKVCVGSRARDNRKYREVVLGSGRKNFIRCSSRFALASINLDSQYEYSPECKGRRDPARELSFVNHLHPPGYCLFVRRTFGVELLAWDFKQRSELVGSAR